MSTMQRLICRVFWPGLKREKRLLFADPASLLPVCMPLKKKRWIEFQEMPRERWSSPRILMHLCPNLFWMPLNNEGIIRHPHFSLVDYGWSEIVSSRPSLHISTLPIYHQDPSDRILIAQAQMEDLPVLSADPEIGKYEVTIIWWTKPSTWFSSISQAKFDWN